MPLKQDSENFYVCVRLRDENDIEETLIERRGAFRGMEALLDLKQAIREYGNTHKVVIEPVEYATHGEAA